MMLVYVKPDRSVKTRQNLADLSKTDGSVLLSHVNK